MKNLYLPESLLYYVYFINTEYLLFKNKQLFGDI